MLNKDKKSSKYKRIFKQPFISINDFNYIFDLDKYNHVITFNKYHISFEFNYYFPNNKKTLFNIIVTSKDWDKNVCVKLYLKYVRFSKYVYVDNALGLFEESVGNYVHKECFDVPDEVLDFIIDASDLFPGYVKNIKEEKHNLKLKEIEDKKNRIIKYFNL